MKLRAISITAWKDRDNRDPATIPDFEVPDGWEVFAATWEPNSPGNVSYEVIAGRWNVLLKGPS